MKSKPLAPRAQLLLRLVAANCSPGRYYVPRYGTDYIDMGNGFGVESVSVSGPGDASTFRGLLSRGLIAVPEGAPVKYAFQITPSGQVEVDRLEAAIRATRPDVVVPVRNESPLPSPRSATPRPEPVTPIMVECEHCGGHGKVQAECSGCGEALTTANQSTDDPEGGCRACAAKSGGS